MLILQKDPKSVASEAFRTLRTNIQYSSFDEKIRTILITSSGPGEGKSTTSCNLALTTAETGKKVLIIDCDLRKPTIHKKFNMSNELGISNYLLGEITFEEAAKQYSENLYVLTCGTIPPNPSEMLSSNKLKEFLNEAKEKFDVVIIDSPPVLAVTDAQILSTLVQGVLLVVASNRTEKDMCVRAKELLMKVNAKILGVVLTRMSMKKGKGYGYGYYYYYESDENGEKTKKKKIKKEGVHSTNDRYSLSHSS
ncbi:CpsD/CapB family tyrosine-protein kinase [Haloimpatiens sp. FM7330]|uniref:CpsD/CapB family tyrosine-protein kinase n=1 Tax=Haloimpatiens sp. FM7330 TaxID=3298610 RepID=UPI003637DBEF